jgi:putative FmdB family regulatory protein
MPVYEYECGACGHRFEEQQRMADAPIKKCPKCKKKKVERLISATSFILKGGGWYKDLYSSPKAGAKGGDAAAGGGDSGSGGDADKVAKPATEGATKAKDAGSSSTASDSKSKDAPASKTSGASKDSGPSKNTGKKTAAAK